MKIFIVDNFDSFTYNLVHILEQFAEEVKVHRNNEINVEDLNDYNKIVFSPGPGLPSDVKVITDILNKYKGIKPILGVCLGHQAIGEYFGSKLLNMPEVNHGREFETHIIKEDYIYNNVPKTFLSGRYHSWVINTIDFSKELEVTSIDNNDQIMSIKHKKYDIRGVQYHPESIMTKHGFEILKNWVLH